MVVPSSRTMDWIVQTKLQSPNLRQDFFPRRRLLETLFQAVTSHRLTLVSAPAGYGKTTLLAALPHVFPELSVAWLSLDVEDNDILETLPDPFLLVLDDLHLVTEPVVYAALDYLLDRMPPHLHLAVEPATTHRWPWPASRLVRN